MEKKQQRFLEMIVAIMVVIGVILTKQSVSATEIRTSGNKILGIFNTDNNLITVTGVKIDQQNLTENNEYSWRVATSDEVAEFNQTHQGQALVGGIEISCSESYFNTLSRNEIHHFVAYYDIGGNDTTMEFDFVIPADVELSSDNLSICNHDYLWEVEKEPTETQDGEVDLKCTKCGDIKNRQPLSSYAYFIKVSEEKINKASEGSTVIINSKIWNSFPKSFFEKLSETQDIKVIIDFTYNHDDFETSISSNEAKEIIESSNCYAYYGPATLIELFGATEKSPK